MIVVFGLGITGVSVCNFLTSKHLAFCIADTRTAPPHADLFCNSTTYFGEIPLEILDNCTSIILSPGIVLTHPLILKARERNIPLLSDIDLCYLYHPEKTYIGITGTNGKSTTAKLLEHILYEHSMNAIACGNIGTPILDVVGKYDIYVIELSSYQLDICSYLFLEYGVVLNISEDHLDRYWSFEAYINSKLHIYTLSAHPIINPQNPHTRDIHGVWRTHTRTTHNPSLIGVHNQENITATTTIAHELGCDETSIMKAVDSFKGLPHRLEYVGEFTAKCTEKNTITHCFNDSKATNSDATLKAIEALSERYTNITIIIGGEMKNENYAMLYQALNTLTHIILLGASTAVFKQHIITSTYIAHSMCEAVDIGLAQGSEVLALSPACASFDMYNNFALRGEDFIQCLHAHNSPYT